MSHGVLWCLIVSYDDVSGCLIVTSHGVLICLMVSHGVV